MKHMRFSYLFLPHVYLHTEKFMLFIEILMTVFYIFSTDFKLARSPYIPYKHFVQPPP